MRRKRTGGGCVFWVLPLMVLCLVGGVLLVPAIPGIVLQVVGFAPEGSVDEFWGGYETPAPAPPVAGANAPVEEATAWFAVAAAPQSVVLDAGSGSVTTSGGEIFADTAQSGQGVDGAPLGVLTYSETALDDICAAWLNDCVTDEFRVTAVDFRPGGAVIYGSVNLGGVWQNIGVAVVLLPGSRSFAVEGVVYNGQVYALPTQGDLTTFVEEMVQEGNALLQSATVQMDGRTLALSQLRLTNDQLILILR